MITYESNLPKQMQIICNDFKRLAESFHEKGYFEYHTGTYPGFKGWSLMPEPSLRYMIRRIAQEAKRPFVRAHIHWMKDVADTHYRSGVTLVVPRRKYLTPIINALLLTPERQYRWRDEGQQPVSWWQNTRDWYVFFRDVSIWDGIAEQMATDPDMRKALKLNPVTSGSNL